MFDQKKHVFYVGVLFAESPFCFVVYFYALSFAFLDTDDFVDPFQDMIEVLPDPFLGLNELPGGHGDRLPRQPLD